MEKYEKLKKVKTDGIRTTIIKINEKVLKKSKVYEESTWDNFKKYLLYYWKLSISFVTVLYKNIMYI